MAIAFAEAGKRFTDGRRMVSEIVDDRDAAHDSANFLTAANALESG